jgi:hypothetical protein
MNFILFIYYFSFDKCFIVHQEKILKKGTKLELINHVNTIRSSWKNLHADNCLGKIVKK